MVKIFLFQLLTIGSLMTKSLKNSLMVKQSRSFTISKTIKSIKHLEI